MNIGNPDELSVLVIAKEVLAVTGSASKIEYIGAAVDDPARRCPDISLARQLLGWAPEIEMAEGLPRTVGWFSQNHPREPLR